MILSHVWEYNFDPQTNVVDVLVSRLREKIDRPFDKKLLHTVRGVGLCPPVSRPGASARTSACAWRCGTRRCSSSASIAIVFLTYYLTAASLAQRDQQIIKGEARRLRGGVRSAAASRARRDGACRAADRARAAVRPRRRSRRRSGRAQQPGRLGSGDARDRSAAAGRRHARRRSGRAPRRATICCRGFARRSALVTLLIVVIALTGGVAGHAVGAAADPPADDAPSSRSSAPAAPTRACRSAGTRRRDRRADGAVQRDARQDRRAGARRCAARSTTCRTICGRR